MGGPLEVSRERSDAFAREIQKLQDRAGRGEISPEKFKADVEQVKKAFGWTGELPRGSAADVKGRSATAFEQTKRPGPISLNGHAPAAPSTFPQRLSEVRADLQRFYQTMQGQEIHHETPIGQGAIASAAWGELSSGQKVIIRHVDDAALSVSLSNASHAFAREIGLDGATYPAAVGNLKGKSVMFMEHAPAGYVAANKAEHLLQNIPDDQRVLGALHDLVTSQDDRFSKNLMIDEHGHYALIDPDWSFGNFNPWGWTKSLFYPGGQAGYTKAQNSFEDLPPKAQETIQKIREMSPKQVAQAFGLRIDLAVRMQSVAELVFQKGLTGAIREQVAQRERMYSTFKRGSNDFEQRFEGTLARRGRHRPGYIVFGPYEPYPKGWVDVDWQIRLKNAVDPETTVATVDIYNKTTETRLASRVLKAKDLGTPGQWAHVGFGADLPDHNNMEFRVEWPGQADVDVGWITATPGRGFRDRDRQGAGGFGHTGDVTMARQGQRGPDYMVFGPYKPFPVGRREVNFQLRLKKPVDPEAVVATLDIYNKSTETPLAQRQVKAKELDADGQWVGIRFGADLPPGNNMEFRVHWKGNSDLDVGTITALSP